MNDRVPKGMRAARPGLYLDDRDRLVVVRHVGDVDVSDLRPTELAELAGRLIELQQHEYPDPLAVEVCVEAIYAPLDEAVNHD